MPNHMALHSVLTIAFVKGICKVSSSFWVSKHFLLTCFRHLIKLHTWWKTTPSVPFVPRGKPTTKHGGVIWHWQSQTQLYTDSCLVFIMMKPINTVSFIHSLDFNFAPFLLTQICHFFKLLQSSNSGDCCTFLFSTIITDLLSLPLASLNFCALMDNFSVLPSYIRQFTCSETSCQPAIQRHSYWNVPSFLELTVSFISSIIFSTTQTCYLQHFEKLSLLSHFPYHQWSYDCSLL